MIEPAVLLLQMCPGNKAGHEYLLDFQFVESIVCTYGNQMGVAVFSLFVFGAIMIAIYGTTNSPLMPFVLTLLTGGLVILRVASPAIAIITLLVLLTGAGTITLLYYKYSR